MEQKTSSVVIKENNTYGVICLGIAFGIFIIAITSGYFKIFSANFNLFLVFLTLLLMILSVYVAYSENINNLMEKYIGQIFFAVFLFLLNAVSSIFADGAILVRTSLPPDLLPRAQTALIIFYDLYILIVILMAIGLFGYFISAVLTMISEVISLKKDINASKLQGLNNQSRFAASNIKKNFATLLNYIKEFFSSNDKIHRLKKGFLHSVQEFSKHYFFLSFLGMFLMSLIIINFFENKGLSVIDYLIVNSSFAKNDSFLNGSTGKEQKIACYNKSPNTYVKLSKEGSSIFAEWTQDPYSIKFYFGTCMMGSPSSPP